MREYEKITYDIPFKYIMAKTPEALKIIVQYVTKIEINQMIEKNTFSLPDKYDEKVSIYDLYFENEDGLLFVVEMQNSPMSNQLAQRIQAYVFGIVHSQMKEGKPYNFKKAYCIILLNNNQQRDCLVEPYQMRRNDNSHAFYSNLAHIYLVNMAYIEKIAQSKPLNEFNQFERIIYALYYNMDCAILKLDDEVINKMEQYRQAFLSNEEGLLTYAERKWLDEFMRVSLERELEEKQKEVKAQQKEFEIQLKDKEQQIEDKKQQIEELITVIMDYRGCTRQQAIDYVKNRKKFIYPLRKLKQFFQHLFIKIISFFHH